MLSAVTESPQARSEQEASSNFTPKMRRNIRQIDDDATCGGGYLDTAVWPNKTSQWPTPLMAGVRGPYCRRMFVARALEPFCPTPDCVGSPNTELLLTLQRVAL